MNSIVKATTSPQISKREIKNAKLARRAASEGFVLLKNDGVLPLERKTIALFGAGARMTVAGGGGSGAMNPRYTVSIADGLVNAGYTITTNCWLDRFDAYYADSYVNYKKNIEEKAKDFKNPMQVIGLVAENRFPFPTGFDIGQSDLDNADTAIYVLIRQAGEGADRYNKEGDYRLSEPEYENIKKLSEHYSKFILVVNVGGLIDLSFMKDININGLMFISQGGMEGGNAFADVISGKISPSGKLACTWAQTYNEYPEAKAYSHYGNPKEQFYREGLFMGYRYFDSFDIKPLYEFGFGLSYSTFDICAVAISEIDGKIVVDVSVENSGNYAGKEVVQIYITPPRTDNQTEYQRLVAFKKTKMLRPGEKECLKLTFDMADCSSYCQESAQFILRQGNYLVRVGNSCKNTEVAALLYLHTDVTTEICQSICKIREKLDEILPPILSCDVPADTRSLVINPANIKAKENKYTSISVCDDKIVNQINKMTTDELVSLVVGAGLHSQNLVNVLGVSGSTTSSLYEKYGISNIALADGPAGLNVTPEVVQLPNGDVKALKLYARYDFGMLGQFLRGRLGNSADGVVHYQYATAWPVGMCLAQTWDTDLIEEIGYQTGVEMLEFGVTVWLAPGINLYRNPLCGRTFEYFSEDPLVSGKIAAAMINGVQRHKGLSVSLKHFACNNSEYERHYSSSNINERPLRELYLKAFRIAIEQSKPSTVMASYNKINGVYSTNNYDLLVKVLRNEWGFAGLVMSDWEAVDIDRGEPVLAMQAQCDLLMPGKKEWADVLKEAVSNHKLSMDDLKRCASRVLQLVSENIVIKI